ncbi:hypothetical protein ACFPZL_13100 [Leucobacter soli]|uniref:hypothetical protein n=1 Tax=Leucobacter soli TaxID=2812850 RepID=UPI00361E65EC
MTARNLTFGFIGLLCAAWMGFGRWAFGLGGELTWWYAPLIALPFAVLQLWTLQRVNVAVRRGREPGRAPYGALVLSWVCALGFGLTVPDLVDGELVSIAGRFGGEIWNEMAIALCNPFGIIAFATAIAALAFAYAAGRERWLSEDELLDAAEAAGAVDGTGMVRHPLSRED